MHFVSNIGIMCCILINEMFSSLVVSFIVDLPFSIWLFSIFGRYTAPRVIIDLSPFIVNIVILKYIYLFSFT